MTMGISNTTQAFWGFAKKANKAEVKSEQTESSMAIGAYAIKGESETAKLSINKEGTAFSLLAGGAKVLSNTAGTLTARVLTAEVSFGSSKVNLTINTNADTKVYRAYDGKSVLFGAENIAVGDILSIEGVLNSTDSSLTVTARKIKDFSAQARDANFSGTIKSITATSDNAGTFVLDVPNNEKDLTVIVDASTTIHKFVKKSLAPVLFSTLAVGDIVKSATGVVNTQTMQMIAKKIVVSERDILTKKIKDVFATVVYVDQGTSMNVKTTTNVVYNVSFKNTNTVYNKWTISKKYSGVKKGSKTDGVTELSTLDGLAITGETVIGKADGNKVWISGELDTKTGTVVPSLIEKEFYK